MNYYSWSAHSRINSTFGDLFCCFILMGALFHVHCMASMLQNLGFRSRNCPLITVIIHSKDHVFWVRRIKTPLMIMLLKWWIISTSDSYSFPKLARFQWNRPVSTGSYPPLFLSVSTNEGIGIHLFMGDNEFQLLGLPNTFLQHSQMFYTVWISD